MVAYLSGGRQGKRPPTYFSYIRLCRAHARSLSSLQLLMSKTVPLRNDETNATHLVYEINKSLLWSNLFML